MESLSAAEMDVCNRATVSRKRDQPGMLRAGHCCGLYSYGKAAAIQAYDHAVVKCCWRSHQPCDARAQKSATQNKQMQVIQPWNSGTDMSFWSIRHAQRFRVR